MGGPEGGVRRNWKLWWEESGRWPRAGFPVGPSSAALSDLWSPGRKVQVLGLLPQQAQQGHSPWPQQL